jgi:paraquat-inducible protein B
MNSISFVNTSKDVKSAPKDEYKLYSSFGKIKLKNQAQIITLRSDKLNSIKTETPLLYKGLQIGKIAEIEYDKRHDNFKFFLTIKDDFKSKINSNSYFVVKSGVDIDVGFDGIKVKTDSLEDVLFGGIELVQLYDKSKKTKAKDNFWLNTTEEFENIQEEKEYFDVYLSMLDANKLQLKTSVIYKGIKIGYLKQIELKNDLILANIKIDKKYKNLIKKDTQIWLEKFTANISQGVQNPESALSGPSIHIYPNKNSKERFVNHFLLQDKLMSKTIYKDGLRIKLKANMKSTLGVDSSIYYRQVKIGNIESIDLNVYGDSVVISCFIDKKYEKFVRKNSKFFLSTAIASQISLFDVKIQTGTFESMLNGTITVVTPKDYGKKAIDGDRYKMYNEPKEEWMKWSAKIEDE